MLAAAVARRLSANSRRLAALPGNGMSCGPGSLTASLVLQQVLSCVPGAWLVRGAALAPVSWSSGYASSGLRCERGVPASDLLPFCGA
eukprot:3995716-Heterocapsa_arctica.AAC.2